MYYVAEKRGWEVEVEKVEQRGWEVEVYHVTTVHLLLLLSSDKPQGGGIKTSWE